MNARLLYPWPLRRLATRFAQAALLLGVIVGGRVEAGAAPALRSSATEKPQHQCKCGQNCAGLSCCCSHGATKAEPAPRRPTAQLVLSSSTVAVSVPCLKAVPCGESGRTASSATGPIGRAAFLVRVELLLAATSRRLDWVSASLAAPARRADRLDEPPENSIGG